MKDKRYWTCDFCKRGITAEQLHDIADHKVRCWSCWEDSYTVERFKDTPGALYTGDNGRAALWQWIDAGCTQISLCETIDGTEHWYDGWIQQSEKADGLCLSWIEERFAPEFRLMRSIP